MADIWAGLCSIRERGGERRGQGGERRRERGREEGEDEKEREVDRKKRGKVQNSWRGREQACVCERPVCTGLVNFS